ncbi:MAG: hypothetical protein OXG82_08710 [Gammaproteobacteria bacterium]|nr:hypothetical protein [Gammaproteobacteria bacterium]
MSKASLDRVTDSELRDAWPDEARDFTPWLFENIDHLSDALGLNLEPIEKEAAVDEFSADIVATEAGSGHRVLIENQLEGSDHKHLGQILTYLAGVDARFVVWVASAFREAHLSALRWLNENTREDLAFFAVRLRVIRIADSPMAPLFEVVESPNAWNRDLAATVVRAESELTKRRGAFWRRYLKRHPGVFEPSRGSNVWVPMLPDGSVVLSMYAATRTSGVFLRGPLRGDPRDFMERHAAQLDEALGPSKSTTDGHYYGIDTPIAISETARWDELIDWLDEQRCRYAETILKVVAPTESD